MTLRALSPWIDPGKPLEMTILLPVKSSVEKVLGWLTSQIGIYVVNLVALC